MPAISTLDNNQQAANNKTENKSELDFKITAQGIDIVSNSDGNDQDSHASSESIQTETNE